MDARRERKGRREGRMMNRERGEREGWKGKESEEERGRRE